ADANPHFKRKATRHPYQGDHAVSFDAIKDRALDLLDRKTDLDALLARLTALFLMNPTSVRPERKPPHSLSHRLD
ncbi:MAG: hypothetical protein ACRERV_10140, partial [Methylococcales bacterium]